MNLNSSLNREERKGPQRNIGICLYRIPGPVDECRDGCGSLMFPFAVFASFAVGRRFLR